MELKKLKWDDIRIRVDSEYLNNLKFPDNIVLFNESEGNRKRMNELSRVQ